MSRFRTILCLAILAFAFGSVGRIDYDDAVVTADARSADQPPDTRATAPLRLACRTLVSPRPQPALVSTANPRHHEQLITGVGQLECVVIP